MYESAGVSGHIDKGIPCSAMDRIGLEANPVHGLGRDLFDTDAAWTELLKAVDVNGLPVWAGENDHSAAL